MSFEGVAVKTVLEKVGVTFGESMKGKRMTDCLLVEAADGYQAFSQCQSWTLLSVTSRLSSHSYEAGNRSETKKGHIGLWFRMRREWRAGSDRSLR